MAAAIAESLNQESGTQNDRPALMASAEEAETEHLLMMIAQKESANMEKDRIQKERAQKKSED